MTAAPATLSAACEAGWTQLLVTCQACRVVVQLQVDRFAAEQRDRPTDRFVAALRCRRCGRRPAGVRLERNAAAGYGGPRSVTMEIG